MTAERAGAISHSEAAHGLVLGPVRLRICPERILISLPPFTWGWGPPWSYIGLRKAKLSRTNPARKSDHTNQRATRFTRMPIGNFKNRRYLKN